MHSTANEEAWIFCEWTCHSVSQWLTGTKTWDATASNNRQFCQINFWWKEFLVASFRRSKRTLRAWSPCWLTTRITRDQTSPTFSTLAGLTSPGTGISEVKLTQTIPPSNYIFQRRSSFEVNFTLCRYHLLAPVSTESLRFAARFNLSRSFL